MIAVRPAQHYTMGGVRTDHTGQSPTLRGLFAAGEAACWDMHGFNRLGGNSVAETVVAGMIVGDFVADFCIARQRRASSRPGWCASSLGAEQAKLDRLVSGRRRRRGRVGDQGSDAERDDGQGRHLPHRCRARVRGRRAAGAARAQPAHRPAARRQAPTPSSRRRTGCRRCSSSRSASPTAPLQRTESRVRISARTSRAATTRSG